MNMLLDAVFSKAVPPTIQDVKAYFSQKGVSDREAEVFFLLHEKRQWTSKKGNVFKNWKAPAYRWIAGIWKLHPPLFEKTIQ
jgi:hypothetical protein